MFLCCNNYFKKLNSETELRRHVDSAVPLGQSLLPALGEVVIKPIVIQMLSKH